MQPGLFYEKRRNIVGCGSGFGLMKKRSLAKRLWYDFLRVFFRLLGVCVFRVRVFGRENIPKNGAVLVLPNHQSHLDPILVGLSCDRRLNYVARDTLFGFAPFRWL